VHALGRGRVRRLAGKRLNSVSRRIARRGVLSTIVLRILPIAPFTVINLVAGVSHLRLRDYALGTVVGMTPGIAAISIFGDSLERAVRDPDVGNFAVLAGVVLVLVALAAGARRLFAESSEQG